jgi:hypothetical protein
MEKRFNSGYNRDIFFQPKKFRWHDTQGRQLTAGGVLPYDDNGIWVICEKKKSAYEYSDMGGKYHFEDGDIYCTMAREFCEELYHSVSLSRKDIIELSKTNEINYVHGYNSVPVYASLIVHTNDLEKIGVKMSPELFLTRRKQVLAQNPHVPEEYYSSVELLYIEFKDIQKHLNHSEDGDNIIPIGNRLKRMLRYSFLYDKIKKLNTEEDEFCNQTKSKLILV